VLGPAQHRACQTFAQHLPIAQTEDTHHPAGIHGLRWADGNTLPAKSFNESDQMAGQAMGGQRLAGANAADGHQLRLSSV
jgi:hypothetical protein